MEPELRGVPGKSHEYTDGRGGSKETYQSPLLYSLALGRAAEARPMRPRERMEEARMLMVDGLCFSFWLARCCEDWRLM